MENRVKKKEIQKEKRNEEKTDEVRKQNKGQ